ncbi:MAG: AAA family ATPase [Acidobacteriia bacterium]|nr:AAA family ATPase [Terriglobia bacterium]
MSSPSRSFSTGDELVSLLSKKVVGQASALQYIVPYIQIAQAGLSPPGRPVGVFLLLGPTGTGKTRTVEALSEILHGSEKSILRIDCGEFQMDHEVAKLIGAPPGYLGHRETQAALSQQQLHNVTSEQSPLSILLFDEIEKASDALSRLLLGVLDKATLRLGDNSIVDFQDTLIFLTSNLGAEDMMRELHPSFGFAGDPTRPREEVADKLQAIALAAVRKRFSPEFVNRIDAVVTYQPLDERAYRQILDQQIQGLQQHVNTRLGTRCFQIEVSDEARDYLLREGTGTLYGARELKRVVHRHLTQPLAKMVALGEILPGALAYVEPGGEGLVIRCSEQPAAVAQEAVGRILIVMDNQDLLNFLSKWMTGEGFEVATALSAQAAWEQIQEHWPAVVLVDHILPEESGLNFAMKLRHKSPRSKVILMMAGSLEPGEQALCDQFHITEMQKPFTASYALGVVRNLLGRKAAAA